MHRGVIPLKLIPTATMSDSPSDAPSARDVNGAPLLQSTLVLATTGALSAGALHVVVVSIRLHVLHRFTWTALEFPWYAPLAYLLCFLLAAVPLTLGGWLLPRLITFRVRATLLVWLSCFAMLLAYPRIDPWAELALALGVGVQVGGLIARHPQRWLVRGRRLSIALAAILAICGLPVIAGPPLREWRRVAERPDTSSGDPNVILLILDTVRAANLGLYGYSRTTTPNLERLALEGVTFENAIAPAPWTAPTHATLATGRFPSRTGVSYFTPIDDSIPTVAEAFERAGYMTGAFMANAGYAGRQTGIDRGFIHFEDYPASVRQLLWSTTLTQTEMGRQTLDAIWDRAWWKLREALRDLNLNMAGEMRGDVSDAPAIADNFIAWRDRIGRRPYFAMLNMLDAHAPYRTPFNTRYNAGRQTVDRYDGAIAYEDSVIGRLVSRLVERHDLDHTILVVLADHGEQFGERGIWGHGNSLYLPLLSVPLVIHAPGRAPAGLRDRRIVSLRDVPATILELAGVPAPEIVGVSLARAWTAGPSAAEAITPALSEVETNAKQPEYFRNPAGPVKSLLDSTWHYIYNGDTGEEVYAWIVDRNERNNLRATVDGARVVASGRTHIARLLSLTWPPQHRALEGSGRRSK